MICVECGKASPSGTACTQYTQEGEKAYLPVPGDLYICPFCNGMSQFDGERLILPEQSRLDSVPLEDWSIVDRVRARNRKRWETGEVKESC